MAGWLEPVPSVRRPLLRAGDGLHLRPVRVPWCASSPTLAMTASMATSSPATTGAEFSASCSPSHGGSIPQADQASTFVMMASAGAMSMPSWKLCCLK
jgi:hypothetical protein